MTHLKVTLLITQKLKKKKKRKKKANMLRFKTKTTKKNPGLIPKANLWMSRLPLSSLCAQVLIISPLQHALDKNLLNIFFPYELKICIFPYIGS